MTTPEPVKTKSTKAWVATIGGLVSAAIPILAQVAGWLPEPYGAVLSAIIALVAALTGGATYQANNAPAGTVLVPAPVPATNPGGTFNNPYRTE